MSVFFFSLTGYEDRTCDGRLFDFYLLTVRAVEQAGKVHFFGLELRILMQIDTQAVDRPTGVEDQSLGFHFELIADMQRDSRTR